MKTIYEAKLEVFADYFQFYIQDAKVVEDLSPVWTEEAVKRLLATGDGNIAIGTARNMTVPVTVKIFDSEPELQMDNENIIQQINECDLTVKSGEIIISGCTESLEDAEKIELQNGIYRVRIYYGNLDKLSEDGLDGEDFYEIHLWKNNQKQGLKIIRDRKTS